MGELPGYSPPYVRSTLDIIQVQDTVTMSPEHRKHPVDARTHQPFFPTPLKKRCTSH
jgi:hypothetical protein